MFKTLLTRQGLLCTCPKIKLETEKKVLLYAIKKEEDQEEEQTNHSESNKQEHSESDGQFL